MAPLTGLLFSFCLVFYVLAAPSPATGAGLESRHVRLSSVEGLTGQLKARHHKAVRKKKHHRHHHHPTISTQASQSGPTGQNLSFDHIIAFGDNLSDNGNGSYEHNRVCGYPSKTDNTKHCHSTIYGYKTWTDGPVAVTYLSDMLDSPLTYSFAFGHASGGSKFGATIKNSYTKSPAGAPDAFDQLANYTSSPYISTASSALHFIWIGNNDINLHHMWPSPPLDDGVNAKFAKDMGDMMEELVRKFIDAGAKMLFVPGLYAKNISPSKVFYGDDQGMWDNMGQVIQNANTEISQRLSNVQDEFSDVKLVYYNVFARMMELWTGHEDVGITHVGGEFCDGYSQADWDLCVTRGKGDEFYWMQYLDPTTRVHQLIAQDMATVVGENFS